MNKLFWIALALMFATLPGCGSTSEETSTQNGPGIEQPAANQGKIKIDAQLFTPTAQMAAVATKAGGGAAAVELEIRKKIDHADFYASAPNFWVYLGTIQVVDGWLTGELPIESGAFNLQVFCRSKAGIDLYNYFEDIVVSPNETTKITMLLKRSASWVDYRVANVPGTYHVNGYYDINIISTDNYSFSTGSTGYIDENGIFYFINCYPVGIIDEEIQITLTDDQGIMHTSIFTTNLLADIDESNSKGYVEKSWPAPGSISIDAIFEADGNYVAAVTASQTAQPHSNTVGTTLSYINFNNGSAKDATIHEVVYEIWDATTISNFQLFSQDVNLGTCEVISRQDYGQALVSCDINHILPAGAIATFELRGDLGDYRFGEWLSVAIDAAKITDNVGQKLPFSNTSGRMVEVLQ